MELEALSCAIAQVITGYHAKKTKTLPSSSENSKTLEEKISEATTGNNSSRLTLLQYMHFGFTLSEQARMAKHTDNIEAIKPELVTFIQNLQRLLTTSNILFRTLTFSTIPGESLDVYLLDYSTSTAHKLIQTLFTGLRLSPESDQASIQDNIDARFENKILKHEVTLLEKQYNTLLIPEMATSNFTDSSSSSTASLDQPGNDVTRGWESISYSPLLENTIPNKILNDRIQELKRLIKKELQNSSIITTQPTEADDQIAPAETELVLAGSPLSFFDRFFPGNNHTPLDNRSNFDYP